MNKTQVTYEIIDRVLSITTLLFVITLVLVWNYVDMIKTGISISGQFESIVGIVIAFWFGTFVPSPKVTEKPTEEVIVTGTTIEQLEDLKREL